MTPFANVDKATWDDLQRNSLRKHVITLKGIYDNLRDNFEKSGESFDGVDKFLNERLRKNANITATEPPIETLKIMDLFEINKNSQPK